jgi:ABC-type phosphonate transport system ATPase subunit
MSIAIYATKIETRLKRFLLINNDICFICYDLGSGKTSLLDCIASRANGTKDIAQTFTSYVMQV